MRCEAVRHQVPDYVLATLPDTEMAEVRRHIRGCAACRKEARHLDEGVAMFADASHSADPPADLSGRVMSVLEEEWREEAPSRYRPRRLLARLPAVAAVVALLVGALTWGVVGQANTNRFREDALAYQEFLEVLGGTDVRVARLVAAPGSPVEASAVVYDSTREMSWVYIQVHAPGYRDDIHATISSHSAGSIELREVELLNGAGDTWLVTPRDISTFQTIRLTSPDGELLASGTVRPHD
ncbi:MAG: zf-HC2 domain-containing protein [Actinomycetota bacterium]